jgi:hypothetical protein
VYGSGVHIPRSILNARCVVAAPIDVPVNDEEFCEFVDIDGLAFDNVYLFCQVAWRDVIILEISPVMAQTRVSRTLVQKKYKPEKECMPETSSKQYGVVYGVTLTECVF